VVATAPGADYELLVKAVRAGKLDVYVEEDLA
jgi:hypothetical protein